MNVDGACDSSDTDSEDGTSVKEEPIEEGDFDLGIVPADAELEIDENEETFEVSSFDQGDATPAPAPAVRRDPMQR